MPGTQRLCDRAARSWNAGATLLHLGYRGLHAAASTAEVGIRFVRDRTAGYSVLASAGRHSEKSANFSSDGVGVGFKRKMAGIEPHNARAGISRRNASAPGGMKNRSFAPQVARRRGRYFRKNA